MKNRKEIPNIINKINALSIELKKSVDLISLLNLDNFELMQVYYDLLSQVTRQVQYKYTFTQIFSFFKRKYKSLFHLQGEDFKSNLQLYVLQGLTIAEIGFMLRFQAKQLNLKELKPIKTQQVQYIHIKQDIMIKKLYEQYEYEENDEI